MSPHRALQQHAAEVRRVTWWGLIINLLLSALKFAGGILGSSQAVVADAIHSLSDSVTDVAVLVGLRFWSKPPDESHPHGHRRIETLVTVAIGLLLAAVAVGLAVGALRGLRRLDLPSPEWIAFAAAVVSIGSKEWLYRWTVAVGRRARSSAVIANAWHHRSDALSSIPAAVAVAGAAFHPAWSFLDPLGALIVTLFILQAAWRIVKPALWELVDTGAPPEECEEILRLAEETEGVTNAHALRTRYVGPGMHVDLHIEVDPEITVREGHDISEKVKSRLIDQGPSVIDVVVHLEPEGDEGD
ncbi:cation transporter [Candidatus Sumerlaeota bacterium]|nr:cation transporter [Candidatus Sumerlaeota bacterium]